MPEIIETAPAKVNLTLKVRGRRSDGYHLLESLIVFAQGAGDVVRLLPDEPISLRVAGPFAGAIVGENLIERTLARLAAAQPRLRLGAVVLEKRLPVASGVGGGSADAAAVLRAVRRANPDFADSVDWHGLAAALGADVPVCLSCEPSIVWGAGENVGAVTGLPRLPAVLANPLAPVPVDKTARVFRELAAPAALSDPVAPAALPAFPDAQALIAHIAEESNDLVRAAKAVVPEIEGVETALRSLPGCRYVGLSGAGPTLFAIFDTQDEAQGAQAELVRGKPDWWTEAAILGG
jgi:4-diphosphocytidyl-2-C-methyl-D-erythritol kinase